jgi:hypothetical protein
MTFRNMISTVLTILAVASPAISTPPIPETPAPVHAVLHARHFTVDNGFPFTWQAERPVVREGTILVLQADPALIRPRQTAEPVLFAGRHTAWRVSPYNEDGIVVAFVPARIDPQAEPIWFGTPELPERIDAAAVDREHALAAGEGIGPLGSGAVRFHDGDLILADRSDLLQALHDLIMEYAPQSR